MRSGESDAELRREGESIALQGCESIESNRERGQRSVALTEGIRGDSDGSSANMGVQRVRINWAEAKPQFLFISSPPHFFALFSLQRRDASLVSYRSYRCAMERSGK